MSDPFHKTADKSTKMMVSIVLQSEKMCLMILGIHTKLRIENNGLIKSFRSIIPVAAAE